jgi:hypothetical protein
MISSGGRIGRLVYRLLARTTGLTKDQKKGDDQRDYRGRLHFRYHGFS